VREFPRRGGRRANRAGDVERAAEKKGNLMRFFSEFERSCTNGRKRAFMLQWWGRNAPKELNSSFGKKKKPNWRDSKYGEKKNGKTGASHDAAIPEEKGGGAGKCCRMANRESGRDSGGGLQEGAITMGKEKL